MKSRLPAALLVCAGLALAGCERDVGPSAGTPARQTTAQTPPPPVSLDIENFDETQQADIRAIVRDYLVRDPTILREALDALSERARIERETEIANDPNSYSVGPADAPITLVEFFDYRCPYCHAAMDWMFDVVRTRRDVRIVFKEFPVLGPPSLEAARAGVAAHRQNRYPQLHRAMMSHRGDLTGEVIDRLAREQGLDVARMRRDMDSDEVTAVLQRNYELATESGVNATPAFLINGQWISGFRDRAQMDAELQRASQAPR